MEENSQSIINFGNGNGKSGPPGTLTGSAVPAFTPATPRTTEAKAAAAAQTASEKAWRDAQIALIESHHQSRSDLAARTIAARRDAAMAEAEDRRRKLQAIIDADPDGPEAQLARLELAAVEKGLRNYSRGLDEVAYRHRARLDHQRAAQIAQAHATPAQGACRRPGLVMQLLDAAQRLKRAGDSDPLSTDLRRLENDQKSARAAVMSLNDRLRQRVAGIDRQTGHLANSVKASAGAFSDSVTGKQWDVKIEKAAQGLGLPAEELRRQVGGWSKPREAHEPAVKELREWLAGQILNDPRLEAIKSQGRINRIRRTAIGALTEGLEKDIGDAATLARDLGADADLTKITDHLQASTDRLVGLSDPADPAAVTALHEKMSEGLERMLQSLSGLVARILGRPAAGGRARVVVDLPEP